ncbi:hypothetical protein ACIBG8_13025 [Nonomuraea sp. NPDC050556]|uniref:hypothetical protein n=1 Tax=Nonomuraea sp. NPDC050556 TaxID=3364369 RepID=UPI0037B5931C
MIELGSRERKQPAPPGIVWECLTNPHRPGGRPWLDLHDDEHDPRILASTPTTGVTWSSLWPARPDDVIVFTLRPSSDGGCALRWTLLTPGPPPPPETLGHLRHRLNYLINASLRFSFGQ